MAGAEHLSMHRVSGEEDSFPTLLDVRHTSSTLHLGTSSHTEPLETGQADRDHKIVEHRVGEESLKGHSLVHNSRY